TVEVGDEVVVTEGAMSGLQTVVTKIMEGQDRVRVLIEWLGQEREAHIPLRSVTRPGEIRTEIRGN
ncbi:MAG: hypothetical protein AAGF67_08055, partial [Verrucomicrobiota bacterium]